MVMSCFAIFRCDDNNVTNFDSVLSIYADLERSDLVAVGDNSTLVFNFNE